MDKTPFLTKFGWLSYSCQRPLTLLSWAYINVMVSLGKPVAVKRNYFIKLLFVDLYQRCGHNQSNVRVEQLS